MPGGVHIEISTLVREQLRALEPDMRRAIVDELYRSFLGGRRIQLPGLNVSMYIFLLDGYAFIYRELTRKELADAGRDSGFLVFDMKTLSLWFMEQING